MKNTIQSAFVLASALCVPQVRPLHAATISWTGGSGDWTNANNWNPTQIPSASDHVLINSGSVTVPADASFAMLDFAGDSLSGSFTVASNSVMNWMGGAIRNALGIASGGVFNVSGSADKYL